MNTKSGSSSTIILLIQQALASDESLSKCTLKHITLMSDFVALLTHPKAKHSVYVFIITTKHSSNPQIPHLLLYKKKRSRRQQKIIMNGEIRTIIRYDLVLNISSYKVMYSSKHLSLSNRSFALLRHTSEAIGCSFICLIASARACTLPCSTTIPVG